tara:strand:+ start:1411 stop:4215 length:2805 start_codon:yes stop_codon:yes gene_type:complete
MSKFQGYAQENRGFQPLQVPDTSRRILEQAEETVRGLQAVRDADIANTASYLNSFHRAMDQEDEFRSESYRMMDLNNEVRKDNAKIRLEEAEARRKLAGQNREDIYKNLASLSKSAAEAYVGFKKQKYDNEYNEEITRLYTQDLADRKDAEGFIADDYTNQNLFIQSTDVLAGARSAEEAGADPIEVAQMRQNTHGLSVAVRQARLDYASERFGITLQNMFANDNQTKVKLYGPNGTFVDGTPSQAVSSRDKAFVAQQVLHGYLKQNGMYGIKSSMLVPALRKMRQQADAIVSSTLQNELNLQKLDKIQALENSVFQSRVEPSAARRFHKAFAGLQFLLPNGRQEARERLFKLMETPRQIVNGVPVGFSDDEITEIANSTLPSMGNKTLGELFRADFLRINQQRAERVYNRYTAEQRAEQMAVKKDHDRLLDTLIEDVTEEDKQLDLSDENIDDLQEQYRKKGPLYNEHVLTLEKFREFTPEAVDEKPYIELARERIKYGMFRPEDAMNLPISRETRDELAKEAKETNTISASKTQRTEAEDHIKAYLRDRAKDHGGKTTHRSLHVMSQYAVNKFSTDYITARRNGLTEQQAYDDAIGKFNAEFDKDSAGMYAIDNNYAKDGFRSGVYKHFKEKEAKTSDYEATATRISETLTQNRSDISTQLVDIDPLKKVAQQLGTGQKPTIVPQIEMVQRLARKPDGSSYSYAEVLMRQMEAHGLKPPKNIEAAIEMENVIPPRYSFLRNYPSPTNTDIMIMSAGGQPVYNRNYQMTPTQSRALDVLGKYESDSVGGYNAMNEGGADGGRTVVGRSGPSKGIIGVNLVDLTVGQVIELQKAGRVHAAGRYQFIGNTLPGVVQRAGVPLDARFNERTQDLLGLTLIRERGIQPWIGPSDKATVRERAIIEAARAQPIAFGPSTWQQSQNMNPQVVERLTPAN